MSRDPESLKELITAKLFNIAHSDQVAVILAAKDPCYNGLKKQHIDEILGFLNLSRDPRNPYPDPRRSRRLTTRTID